MSSENHSRDPYAILQARLLTAQDHKGRLEHYLDFFRKPHTVDYSVQLHTADEALCLLKSREFATQGAELYLWRAMLRLRLGGKYQQFLADITDSCQQCTADPSCAAADILFTMAPRLEALGQPGEAIMLYTAVEQAYDAADEKDSSRKRKGSAEEVERRHLRRAEASYRKGECHLLLGAIEPALEAHRDALKRREELERNDLVAISLAGLARVSAERGDTDDAQILLRRCSHAISICENRGELAADLAAVLELVAQVHLLMCERSDLRGYTEKAQEAAFKAFQLYHRLNDDQGKARVHLIFGRLLEAMARLSDANDEYKQGLELLAPLVNEQDPADSLHSVRIRVQWVELLVIYGSFLCRREQHDWASILLHNAEEGATALNHRRLLRAARQKLAEIYAGMNRFDRAYHYQGLAYALATELADETYRYVLAERQAGFDREEAERNRTKLEKAASSTSHAKQELKTAVLRFNEHMSLLGKIADHVKAFIKSFEPASGSIMDSNILEVQNLLEKALRGGQDYWDQFLKLHYNEDDDYMQCLHAKHPELADSELRVAAMTRSGLSIPDIAKARSVAVGTIYRQRSYIAEKIGLKSVKELDAYLRSICT